MKGKKTTEEKKEEVKALLYINPYISQREISRQTNIPLTTVHEIQKTIVNTDEFEQVRTQKKQEFIDKAWNVVQKALVLTEKRFDKALENEAEFDLLLDKINDSEMTLKEKSALLSKLKAIEMTNIRDIAITLGTIYDKQALASGEPITISETTEPTPVLIEELEAKMKQLKQLISKQ